MSENCKDCIHLETLKNEVQELKVKVNELAQKVNIVEKDTAINQEQTKMVFKILTEIKDSIEKISSKFDEIESRPTKLLWGVAGTVIGALIIFMLKLK